MFLYISLIIVAAVIQISTIYWLRIGFLKSFLWAIPFILIHQYLFLYNYTKAPNFIVIWFLTAGITSLLSLLVGYWFFKDIVSVYQIMGIILIVAGMVFLKF